MMFFSRISEKITSVANKKWKTIAFLLFLLAAIFFGISLIEKLFVSQPDTSKIAWISDIHADRFKRRDVDSGRLYPKKYKEYLPKIFQELKKQGIGIVVATGDNTNSGDDNYARDLSKIARENRMKVIWTKGNHDNDEVMDILIGKDRKRYYYEEIANTRIIVLDDTEDKRGEYFGGIKDEQMEWLKNALDTDKNVIVAMHIPIFQIQALFGTDEMVKIYEPVEKMFKESGNVKLVLSGHYHMKWQKELDGIGFFGESALTRDGEEGGYAIIDLKDFSVKYMNMQL